VKLDLFELNRSSSKYSGIAFGQSDKFDVIESGIPFDICYSLMENEFRGKTTIQLLVRDIKRNKNY
jgi:single-stranded-DNA-specific exonuclease